MPTTVAGVSVLVDRIDGLDAEALRSVMDSLRERMGSGVIFLGSVVDGTVNLVASTSKDLMNRVHAGKLMQEVAPLVGGKGGGRPDMAQGGGPNASQIDKALARVPDLILPAPTV